jgi:hypothetical protein
MMSEQKYQFDVQSPLKHDGELLMPGTPDEPTRVRLTDIPVPEVSDETPLDKLVAIIGGLDTDDKTQWTADGKPDANVLTELSGTKVSAKARDDAFARYQAEVKDKTGN